MYGWLIGGLTALDLGIKQVIEDQGDETFPRDLPARRGGSGCIRIITAVSRLGCLSRGRSL